MVKNISIALPPHVAASDALFQEALAEASGVHAARITGHRILKRSIDARSRSKGVQIVQQLAVYIDEPPVTVSPFDPGLQNVSSAPQAIIIGAGPAGLFAALKLISLGIKPVILERGKDVRARRRDLAAMNKAGIVNSESNYCFGEGGAGTYSDGKLYTRATKRGNVQRILELFIHFGADARIRYEAHPHIGTNKLPQIITAMREAIVHCGGEVHFDKKVSGLNVKNGRIREVQATDGSTYAPQAVVLATGHSARDVFTMLHDAGILVESKPFALGVRIEHPQEVIDAIQYHCAIR